MQPLIHHSHTTSSIKMRLIVALLMVGLGFIGVIVTQVVKDGAWQYWRILCVIYAVMSLVMSWHFKRQGWRTTTVTLWHEVAHWVGLFGVIIVTSYCVEIGLISRFAASILALLLLSLATYLAGIYIEATFILIGILLAAFAAAIAFLAEYLWAILLPLTAVAAIVLLILARHAHKKLPKV